LRVWYANPYFTTINDEIPPSLVSFFVAIVVSLQTPVWCVDKGDDDHIEDDDEVSDHIDVSLIDSEMAFRLRLISHKSPVF